MVAHFARSLSIVLAVVAVSAALAAGDVVRTQPVPVSYGPTAVGLSTNNYDYWIEDGLYATVTANSFDKPKVDNEKKYKVKPEGFEKDIEVRAIWQSGRRPLAVLLLGLASRSKGKMAQLWKCHLRDAGFHVLTFDSPFLPAFGKRSRHGVAGNVKEEARLVANLVAAFLKKGDARERVTSVGVVGISYGATLGLNLAKMAQEGRCPFALDRAMAFSPPVRMRTAARHLDIFYRDRWNYTLAELADDLLGHKPVPGGQPVPFEAAEMRAGIAAAFRMDLTEVIEFSDGFYRMKMLPEGRWGDGEYRRDVAGTWSFERFVNRMCFQYWYRKGKVRTVEELWEAGDLTKLLQDCPANVRVVIAEDDPLNDPSELAMLKAILPADRITLLPYGGHMGYNDTKWVRNCASRLFE